MPTPTQQLSSDAPRVVLFTDADVFAGTERHMLDLARGLRDLGVSVQVACPTPAALEARARAEGLPTLAVPKRGLLDWDAARTLARLLRAGEADIIHAHNGRTALAGGLAVRLAGRGRLVTTQHFLEPNHATLGGPKAFLFRRAHEWVTSQTSRIIAISEAVRAALLARGEAPDAKITVIPNGIAPPDAGPLGASSVRDSLGIAPDAPLVVCVARLEPEKDIGSLLTAMGLVIASVPAARCVVAGHGTQRDVLEAQAGRLSLADVVRFLGFREDAPALMAAGDVFVLPSPAEPFGLVLLEAMALGKPVVATQAGGPLEIVQDGRTGLLVPPSSPDNLAGAIIRLLSEPDTRRQMGINAQARFADCFTAARMARETLAVYRQAVGPDDERPASAAHT